MITSDDGTSSPELRGIDPFQMLDITISKDFSNGLNLGVGARNIFNVTSVNNDIAGGAAHGGGGGGNTPIAYGRSYFARISYQFIKQ